MDRRTRLCCRRIFVAVVSFIVTLAALIAIPYLHEIETCLTAAMVITGAYGWFAAVVWANVMKPLLDRDKRLGR